MGSQDSADYDLPATPSQCFVSDDEFERPTMLALTISQLPREEMLQEMAVQGSDKAAVAREDTLQELAVQGSDKAAATAHTHQSKRTIKRRGQRKRAADRRARPTVVLKPRAARDHDGQWVATTTTTTVTSVARSWTWV